MNLSASTRCSLTTRLCDQEGLDTLLDLVHRSGFDWICAQACALLQPVTGVEATDELTPESGSRKPFKIQLAAVVPLPPLPLAVDEPPKMHESDLLSFGKLSLGFGVADLRRLLLCSISLVGICEILAMSDAETAAWFCAQPCTTTCDLDTSLVCFTDGSYTPATSTDGPLMGWAAAFFHVFTGFLHALELPQE